MHMHVGEWDDMPSHKVRTEADRLPSLPPETGDRRLRSSGASALLPWVAIEATSR